MSSPIPFRAMGCGKALCAVSLALSAGCVSPYAGREPYFVRRQYVKMRNEARKDPSEMGQFRMDGRIEGVVTCSGHKYDTRYFDRAELAHGIVPLAYRDMARSSLKMRRYTDAIHCGKEAVRQGTRYFGEDKWMLHRLLNLTDCHRILYESYLYLGDLNSAAASHRQCLLLSQVAASKALKTVTANTLNLRLSSMRMRSEYAAKQHWKNFELLLTVAATAAQAQQQEERGDHSGAMRTIAQGMMIAELIAEFKREMEVRHGLNIANLMTEAETINRLPQPSAEDIARAKTASELYTLACARDPDFIPQTAGFSDLREMINEITKGLAISYEGGKLRVRGNLAALIAASMNIDEIPLKLPPPPAQGTDEYLDKYLTPDLYRMAGLKMTDEEAKFFKRILEEGGQDYTFDPTDEKALVMINGIRRMMQKNKEFDKWAASI